jgi:hypothetical protein
MKMTMIPGACQTPYQQTGGSFCESCFASFLRRGANPDVPCITAVEQDGVEDRTLVVQVGAHTEMLLLTDNVREDLACGGWPGWQEYVARLG